MNLKIGKTDRCHPDFQFPASWDVTHSENHWSNEETMLRFVDNVIFPYVQETRQAMGLSEDQKALVILDVFKAHLCESLKEKLTDKNILHVYVPAGCTGELQPLDLSFNQPLKTLMKELFTHWYADQISDQLSKGVQLDAIKIDQRI